MRTAKTEYSKKNIILLLSGKFASELGNGIFFIALSWLVLSRHNGVQAFGYIMFVRALPSLFIAPFAGVLIDRFSKRGILVISDLLQGLVFGALVLAYVYEKSGFFVLATISALNGVFSTVFEPTSKATIPLIVPKKNIAKANSASASIKAFTNMFGIFAGGLLVSISGVLGCFVFNSVSFILSGISELFIIVPKVKSNQVPLSLKSIFQEMKTGFLHVVHNRNLKIVFIYVFIFTFLIMPSGYLLFPIILKKIFNFNETVFALVQVGFPAGMIMGSMVIMMSKSDQNKSPILSFIISSIVMSLLVFLWGLLCHFKLENEILNIFLLTVSTVIMGVLSANIMIKTTTYTQKSTNDNMLGKVMSILTMVTTAVVPFGMLFFSTLVDVMQVASDPFNVIKIFFGVSVVLPILFFSVFALDKLIASDV